MSSDTTAPEMTLEWFEEPSYPLFETPPGTPSGSSSLSPRATSKIPKRSPRATNWSWRYSPVKALLGPSPTRGVTSTSSSIGRRAPARNPFLSDASQGLDAATSRDPLVPTTILEDGNDNPFISNGQAAGTCQDPIAITLPSQGIRFRADMDHLKRGRGIVSESEYCTLGSMSRRILEGPKEVREWFLSHSRKNVSSECLAALSGLGEKSCRKVVNFAMTGERADHVARTGRPKGRDKQEEVMEKVLAMVMESNERGEPNSSVRIANQLRADHDISCSPRTIIHILRALGLYCGKGVRQNILHDAPVNVAYRHEYLRRRFRNLTLLSNGNYAMMRPEVFLDESYCLIDHTAPKRWVRKKGGSVNEAGRKPLLVIFATFVVHWDYNVNDVRCQFVKDSVHIWPSIGKAHLKTTSGGRSTESAQLWSDVPDFVRNSGVIAMDHDYHGNFNAELFAGLFKKLCQNLQAMGLGPCNIHLDGASYHFHKEDKRPNSTFNLQEIKDWYAAHDHELPEGSRRGGPTRAELLDHVKTLPDSSHFTIVDIALDNGGHEIVKTPPYYCELQPIEKIRAVVKNMVAANIHVGTTALGFKQMLVGYFAKIPSRIFRSVWLNSIRIGEAYLKAADKEHQYSTMKETIHEKSEEDILCAIGEPGVIDNISRLTEEDFERRLNIVEFGEQDEVTILNPDIMDLAVIPGEENVIEYVVDQLMID